MERQLGAPARHAPPIHRSVGPTVAQSVSLMQLVVPPPSFPPGVVAVPVEPASRIAPSVLSVGGAFDRSA